MPGGKKDSSNKLWSKGTRLHHLAEKFTVGDDYIYDNRLVYYDCIASIAHAKMLAKIGVLKKSEVRLIERELKKIIALNKNGAFSVTPEQEDCHTAIEQHLTAQLGEIGAKIHTGRSRNDQVLTALRLYYKQVFTDLSSSYSHLAESIKRFLFKYGDIEFPGYTHSRKAMPSSIRIWGEAFLASMQDNRILSDTVYKLINQSPAGTGAGYGVPLAIDRKFLAEELGFAYVQDNPVYVQLSRGKFELSILHFLAQVMLDLNRISSDLILFTMPEFGFFILSDELTTGSSIMPQKKNPDMLELIRARYHIVSSIEAQMRSMMSNLTTGYHRDVQFTKHAVMQAFDTGAECISMMTEVFSSLRVDEEKCKAALTPELYATEEVYNLVKQGIPFREAYRTVAKKYG
jgi:argininosuccinate lyase